MGSSSRDLSPPCSIVRCLDMVPVTIGVGYVGWMGIVIAAGVGVGVGGEC